MAADRLLRAMVRRYVRDAGVKLGDVVNVEKSVQVNDKQKDDVDFDKKIEEVTKKSKIARLVRTIGSVLGMQSFLIKMEGNQIELSLLSLVGLKYVTGYSADVVGAMVGLVILIYYAVVAVMTMRCSIAIWEQVENCRGLIHTDRQIEHARKSPLGKIIDLKKMPYPSLAFYFEDLKLPTYYWQLLLPVVMFLRSLVTSIFVVFVVNQAKNQIIVVGLVEVFALAYEILARSRHS